MPAIVREFGIQPYVSMADKMRRFTEDRTDDTLDEIWVLEHYPVYTLGLNGKMEHLLNPNLIPVINTDRGGQITYHGPGQLVVYPLLDLKRLKLDLRQLVTILEDSMIVTLAKLGITAVSKPKAPGVYVSEKKIGSIGIRIKQKGCYHGLSLNNNMDLTPFDHINTCGFKDLQVTQIKDFEVNISIEELGKIVIDSIKSTLSL